MNHIEEINKLIELGDSVIYSDYTIAELGLNTMDARPALKALVEENNQLRLSQDHIDDLLDVNEKYQEGLKENKRLRDALGQIGRMKTMPDHSINTTTLVAAHTLADRALLPQTQEKE